MKRSISMLLVLPLVFGVTGIGAQMKKPATAGRIPTARDASIGVTVFMRDSSKNELMLETKIWPDNPDYNAAALQRLFAAMKAFGPAYKQDDEVAYTWATKGKVTKCSVYLESMDAGVKSGTGSTVGCEANGVSLVAVTSVADPKHPPSSSQDPKHLADMIELFKKQSDRAKGSLPK